MFHEVTSFSAHLSMEVVKLKRKIKLNHAFAEYVSDNHVFGIGEKCRQSQLVLLVICTGIIKGNIAFNGQVYSAQWDRFVFMGQVYCTPLGSHQLYCILFIALHHHLL